MLFIAGFIALLEPVRKPPEVLQIGSILLQLKKPRGVSWGVWRSASFWASWRICHHLLLVLPLYLYSRTFSLFQ